jgi:hypothetical protein
MKESVFGVIYDQFFQDEKIIFVKIDVEGAEYEVLKGMQKALSQHRPVIACEILDSYSEEVLAFTQERASAVCHFMKSLDYLIIKFKTNASRDRIIDHEVIDEISIKQWTPLSAHSNDYIFIPAGLREKFTSIFNCPSSG